MNDKTRPEEPRTRTPRLNPYVVNVSIPGIDKRTLLVEAHSITAARAWAVETLIDVVHADHRDVHRLGQCGTPLFNAHDEAGNQVFEPNPSPQAHCSDAEPVPDTPEERPLPTDTAARYEKTEPELEPEPEPEPETRSEIPSPFHGYAG